MMHDDQRHPFDADRFLETFQEEPERIVHAADDPVLGEMATRAQQTWDAFLEHSDDDATP